MNNDMDHSPTSEEDLVHAKYRFDGIFVFSVFDKMVHFKEKYTLLEDSFKASDELCRTNDLSWNIGFSENFTQLWLSQYYK